MKGITQNTGDAKIDRQGQTAQAGMASDPNLKAVRRPEPRDLRP